jgi:RNA polymerase sigma-70 factor (ECF subfamily)
VWSIRLTPEDRDDLCAEVLLELVQNDFAVLRHFRGTSSLATYLTVVARRIVLKELRRRPSAVALTDALGERLGRESVAAQGQPDLSLEEHEEVERLLAELPEREARIVRMYHLDEKSYRDISRSLGIPENSVGPLLSRARTRMRRAGRYPSLPRCSQ